MTTPNEPPRVDNGGCEDNHCHRPRSPRQEGSRNAEGVPFGCHRPAGWGTTHQGYGACKLHGGNTRTGIVRAHQEAAETLSRTYGVPVDVDPAEALLEEVQRSAGVVRYLEVLVGDLDPEALGWTLTEENREPGIRSEDGETLTERVTQKWKAETPVLVKLYQQERRHLREVCRDAVAAGVSQRMVSLYEQAGGTFVSMIDRVLATADLTAEQHERVSMAIVRELRSISGE